MKIPAGQVENFLSAPGSVNRAVLLYGPDTGLVRERAKKIITVITEDINDPFRVTELNASTLKQDPARLTDEVSALSFSGGQRAIRIPDGADSLTSLFKDFFKHPVGEGFIVVEAGELSPRSTLRKLFESEKTCGAIACYGDEGHSLVQIIRGTFSKAQLDITPDAMAFLNQHLGGDRLMTRSELDKIVLYKGGESSITLDDVIACTGDSSTFSLDSIALAAADGNQDKLEEAIEKAMEETIQPIAILRSVARHFQRLHLASGLVREGQSIDQAVKQLRPPIFFKVADRFKAQVRRWPAPRLAQALTILTEAELDCKVTQYPAVTICNRALMRITQAGKSRR
ncbi:MAG: DNA polymerase III subunit delta [Rhodospirillales bacterium]|nr:DNA polymerase III subunit delta [Rhodospirillales bacterium]